MPKFGLICVVTGILYAAGKEQPRDATIVPPPPPPPPATTTGVHQTTSATAPVEPTAEPSAKPSATSPPKPSTLPALPPSGRPTSKPTTTAKPLDIQRDLP